MRADNLMFELLCGLGPWREHAASETRSQELPIQYSPKSLARHGSRRCDQAREHMEGTVTPAPARSGTSDHTGLGIPCNVVLRADGQRAHQLQSHAEGKFMANLKGLASFVSALRVERTNLVSQLRHVDAALSVLGKLNGGSSYTQPRRALSASARKRISLAQKARWAKAKGHAPRPKRTMSAAGRRKIAAAF
jgi:hypothetical protein